MYNPLDKQSDRYYESILEKLQSMISNGELKEGDCLPSERELASFFDVSRVPVREALKTLEYMGVITNIRGKGMLVNKASLGEIISKFSFAFTFSDKSLDELFEYRIAIESAAAEIASKKRTEEDIQKMRTMVESLENISTIKADDWTFQTVSLAKQYSYGFHKYLIEASHNSIFVANYSQIHSLINTSLGIALGSEEKIKHAVDAHREILDSIIQQNAEAARWNICVHLQRSHDYDFKMLQKTI